MPTIVTKTVGTTGRDYSTLTAALAALPSNLVTADQAWVFELYNDSEFTENINLTGVTTDATRNITIRAASGQGFRNHANKLTNALRYNQSFGVGFSVPGAFTDSAIKIGVNNVIVDGIQFHHTANGSATQDIVRITANNVVVKNCLMQNSGALAVSNCLGRVVSGTTGSGFINCIGIERSSAEPDRIGFGLESTDCFAINCGALRSVAGTNNRPAFSRDYGTPLIRNCWSLGYPRFGRDTTGAAGSGYNATDNASGTTPGTNNIYNLTAANQVQSLTQNSEDARVKSGSAFINAGTRDQTYTGDLDIVNTARSTTTPTIGPWEFSAGDSTAPTLSSGVGTATGSTTATVGATTDEANGTMYAIVSTSSTPPSSTQIQAGQTNTGSAAPWSGNQAITTTGAKTFNATGLTASTTYYPYVQHKDAAGNNSTVLSGPSFTTSAGGDTTPPTLTSPTGTATGSTTASGTVSTNEANGTLYYLATTNSTETAATVKASGASQAVTATGTQNVSVIGLTASTTYYMHYVHRDAAGNDSTVSNSSSFTTNAGGTLTIGVLKNNTGTVLASQTGITVHVYTTAGAFVVTKTGQTSNGSGNMTVTDGAINVGTTYRCVIILSSTAEGLVKVTAT